MWLFDRDLWIEIFHTLGKNMFRTFLTMLGVIFAMIILVLLLGSANGMSNGFNKIFAGTASNSLFVWGQSTSEPYKGFERGRRINYKLEDAEILKRQIPEIEVLAPRIELADHRGTVSVYRNGQTSGSAVYGDFPEIDNITKKKLVEGRFLNQTDIEDSKKVCVIGEETYKLLFEKGEKAMGQEIRINGVYFTVVGIYKPNNNINIDGENAVFIPFSTFQKAFNSGDRMGWMAIAVEENTPVPFVESQIKSILKTKYDIHPDDERAIGSFDMSEIFNNITAFTTVLQGFSFFVGIFTLLAGVIAISNILLITVKERTQEIGVRRALGATPVIVKRQIVVEAIVLTAFAGLVGFAVAVGILSIMNAMWGSGDNFPFVKPMISIPQFVVSFILMVGLSVLIGLLPANRAVRIKPIDALREE
ncbi:MAG TPA: multidrug ABC transporter ATP-binding protein [Muricauda sp.]|uniref:ABC transporter permease n=1 Tax=Flagellimonas aurea TaxID=2915619 RepID=A0ABS3G6K2_9FLAO|nr:ABC transporter permease [Allomuricauda aurea]MAO18637.1 multidrug ABC transporter ATP-binding protein [Allomuricauda sp.]UBZ12613.1 ABC transporter permease [Allomuricauda aquimarina]MBC72772.1 multidrug ABC transporter ATP-binding protein [Allomuricauda sp.]MBO0355051.1 ABC transporter permease [Allomuricauda aurea]HBU79785.1 multidrug ABC transporter ATP-binding protein [Allomuricauda sp.]